jgi:hypothetical protein
MKDIRIARWGLLAAAVLFAGLACSSSDSSHVQTLVVNSLDDTASPSSGVMTLRSAIGQADSSDTITFDASLDGKTILLSLVGESHTTLKGEVYSGMTFAGYEDRDYGASALYARKNLIIDASNLGQGITIKWDGGDVSHARVLAVYGNLIMKNVTIASGYSNAEAISSGTQPYTLARGGGLAVWGKATLRNCAVIGNTCIGDVNGSRDRGTYGGGIFANGLDLEDCVVSGNRAWGYGAAGGGIYSVGGADNQGGMGNNAVLVRCAVTGNRTTAQHSYGGGIFTLSGGPNNLATMYITNCTVARNLVEDNPDLPEAGQYYYRGGGIYMGGGSLSVESSTIAENEVTGNLAMFSGKPNMGGGGVAATIGNAHVVENVWLWHSIVVGNKLNGVDEDWYAGSILFFNSLGYNLIGVVDFSQILVPVPDWMMTSRKHYPKVGDHDGVALSQALSVAGVHTHPTAVSAGTDAGLPAVLWYPPAGMALDEIPPGSHSVTNVIAGYTGFGVSTDDFLNYVLAQIRTVYGAILGNDFGEDFGDLTGVTWYGPAVTWPTNAANADWINFWRALDTEIGDALGQVKLGDDFWGTFTTGPLGSHVFLTVATEAKSASLVQSDQLGQTRPAGSKGDIGAIED